MIPHRRFLRSLSRALLVYCVTIATIVAFVAFTTADPAFGAERAMTASAPASRPPPMLVWGRRHTHAATQYTIDDVGAPPTTLYFPGPNDLASFNDSGQLLGTTLRLAADSAIATCLIYAGGKFVDLMSKTGTGCGAQSLSNADGAGDIWIVGSARTAYSSGAFTATFNVAAGTTHATFFGSHTPSTFYGVNSAGEAVGTAYYAPLGGFVSPAIVGTAAGSSTLVLGQPQCTKPFRYCATMVPNLYARACPFGGCFINDAGTILAVDAANNDLMTFSYGKVGSERDLPFVASPGGFWQLNDAGDVLYGNAATPGVFYYAQRTGQSTTIPLPGGCANPASYNTPLSISNTGEVLGYTTMCGPGLGITFWTWTSTSGTQNLNDQIPSTSAYMEITPLGVNDKAQILVALKTSAFGTHWGTLDPPTSANTKSRGPQASRQRGNE